MVKGHDELSDLSKGISMMSITLKEKQDLEKNEEEKKLGLIADISHDIRTPLTSIIGYTQLIQENEYKDVDKCKEYMEVINRRLFDMKAMLEQLFEYTKLNRADYTLSREKVDLVPLFMYIDNEYSRIYRNNDLGWKLDIHEKKIEASIDTEKFMRAMSNLLDNAKKYGKKNQEVHMSLKQQDNQVVITISNGIDNVDKLDIHKIFDRFYKSDEARTGTNSTGLGLPIVKEIIELHNGNITVNKNNSRIIFIITIPK